MALNMDMVTVKVEYDGFSLKHGMFGGEAKTLWCQDGGYPAVVGQAAAAAAAAGGPQQIQIQHQPQPQLQVAPPQSQHPPTLTAEEISKGKKFKCTNCDKAFKSRPGLRMHFKKNHGDYQPPIKKLKCDRCDKRYKSKLGLKLHLKSHIEGLLKCTMCDKSFRSGLGLKLHFEKHFNEDGTPAQPQPSTQSSQPPQPQALVQTQAPPTQVQIQPLQLVHHAQPTLVTTTQALAQPQPAHHQPLQLTQPGQPQLMGCSSCDKTFKSELGLKLHQQRHFTGPPSPVQCNQCDKVFQSKNGLKYHQDKHNC